MFPWIISVPLLYQPGAIATFINFTSLFFVSFTDFVVPWCLYIISKDLVCQLFLSCGVNPGKGRAMVNGLNRIHRHSGLGDCTLLLSSSPAFREPFLNAVPVSGSREPDHTTRYLNP